MSYWIVTSRGATPNSIPGYLSQSATVRKGHAHPLPLGSGIRESSRVTDPRQLPTRPIEQVRERVVEALSEHFARDNLSLDELETRMARVYSASTPAEVDSILDGLPALAVGAPVPAHSD